jgi:ABC-type branched-subunit amino acid transport system ATPase component
MFVNRLCFRDVKPLNHDIPEDGQELPEPARSRLLLVGGNGSGKTTILETIRTLWEFFGEWIERGSGKPALRSQARHYLSKSGFAAVEIGGLLADDHTLWIGVASENDWTEFKRYRPGSQFAGLVRRGTKDEPGRSRIELPLSRNWKSERDASLVGRELMPNIIHFPPDNRTIVGRPKHRARLVDTTRLNWSAICNPRIDLDSILLTIKALRPDSYEWSLRFVNLALAHSGKRITGFGEDRRLVVEGMSELNVKYHYPVEELSSGERQMLLLIAYTAAFLREGGIVLIDDPDLHIHVSMVSQLIETLESVIQERSGQLIVASHSSLVWDWFCREEERIEPSHPSTRNPSWNRSTSVVTPGGFLAQSS